METLTDIVFEKRNKAYGAYILRQEYRNVILISMLLAIFLLASVIAYPVFTSYKGRVLTGHNQIDVTVTVDNSIKPEVPVPPVTEPALPEVKFNFITPKVVDEDVESGMITQDELGNKNTSDVPVQLTDEKPADILPPVKVIETPVEQPPMVIVQEMPVFSGGEDEMYKYLAANIKYPQEARELGIQGKVYIEFVIEPDGSVSHITVKRGIGSGCDEEAARVVSSMPKWNPGKQNGQAVRVLLTLPVKFVLN